MKNHLPSAARFLSPAKLGLGLRFSLILGLGLRLKLKLKLKLKLELKLEGKANAANEPLVYAHFTHNQLQQLSILAEQVAPDFHSAPLSSFRASQSILNCAAGGDEGGVL